MADSSQLLRAAARQQHARLERNTEVGSLRFAFMPVTELEIAITRFLQFCGGGNNCYPLEAAFAINNTDSDRNNSNDDGFRYRGRTFGFSLDSDSVLFSLTGALTDRAGRQYRLSYYNAQISTQELARIQADGSFRRNSVSAQPVQIDQVEGGISLLWNRLLFDLAVRWQDDQPFPKSGSAVNVEAGVQLRF